MRITAIVTALIIAICAFDLLCPPTNNDRRHPHPGLGAPEFTQIARAGDYSQPYDIYSSARTGRVRYEAKYVPMSMVSIAYAERLPCTFIAVTGGRLIACPDPRQRMRCPKP